MTLPWPEALHDRPWSLWRYREALPFPADAPEPRAATMGEGMTGIVDVAVGDTGVMVRAKLDYAMPTGSFKDRGAAVMMAAARARGVTHAVADSSGNAGVAVAAYAARLGIACEVFLPAAAPATKTAPLVAHGAVVHRVSGTREDVAAAARAAVAATGAFYASHVADPRFLDGTKTFAFELWEQLGDTVDHVVLPVGNGTYLLGVALGYSELLAAGLVTRVPAIHAVQAASCAPLATAWQQGRTDPVTVVPGSTVADGIAVAVPRNGAAILATVARHGGMVVAVPDPAIISWQTSLARQGLYVEPTAAATFAGVEALARAGALGATVVAPLCGSGLKDVK